MSSTLQSPWDSLSERDNPISQEAYVTWWEWVSKKQVNKERSDSDSENCYPDNSLVV